MAQKVKREGPKNLPRPSFIAEDLYMMVRHSIASYKLLCYLNADERLANDIYWNNAYGAVTAPTVRSMIDCLYNVTAVLQNPAQNGSLYRKSGLKKKLFDIEEDHKRYGGRAEWDAHNDLQLRALDILIRQSGYTEQEIRKAERWPTLGTYIQPKAGGLTKHQKFLKTFTYLHWRQYSALLHGAFEGYIGDIPSGLFFATDSFPHEERPKIERLYRDFVTSHLGRAATVLLCLCTEIQAYFRFVDANINERVSGIWHVLTQLFEAKELYDEWYCALMKERGITPTE
jgi:hypothetical protein